MRRKRKTNKIHKYSWHDLRNIRMYIAMEKKKKTTSSADIIGEMGRLKPIILTTTTTTAAALLIEIEKNIGRKNTSLIVMLFQIFISKIYSRQLSLLSSMFIYIISATVLFLS